MFYSNLQNMKNFTTEFLTSAYRIPVRYLHKNEYNSISTLKQLVP